jgi:hypothetical protein
MCTTFAECKTVIIVMLTVKSGMDSHKISQYSGWFRNGWVVTCCRWGWNILVELSSWSWRFCGRVVQLELEFPCSDI